MSNSLLMAASVDIFDKYTTTLAKRLNLYNLWWCSRFGAVGLLLLLRITAPSAPIFRTRHILFATLAQSPHPHPHHFIFVRAASNCIKYTARNRIHIECIKSSNRYISKQTPINKQTNTPTIYVIRM